MTDRANLERFVSGVSRLVVPVAEELGLQSTWLPRHSDETLCALFDDSICLLVYLAMGHGINLTVCVAPTFDNIWYPPSERGLSWLTKYLGLAPWDNSRRYASYDGRDEYLLLLARLLPELVAAIRSEGTGFWPKLYAFVQDYPGRVPT